MMQGLQNIKMGTFGNAVHLTSKTKIRIPELWPGPEQWPQSVTCQWRLAAQRDSSSPHQAAASHPPACWWQWTSAPTFHHAAVQPAVYHPIKRADSQPTKANSMSWQLSYKS